MMHWIKQYVVGVGSHGPVHLATPCSANNYLIAAAVKSTPLDRTMFALRRQGRILNELKGSPYIVRCFGDDVSVEYGKKTYNLLLECAHSGTLLDYILFNGKISEQEAARYAYQLLMGIRHIHTKWFSHCDIKLSNILVFPTNKLIKIADFGSAEEITTCDDYRDFDVLCVGCVVVKMLTGDPTWSMEDNKKYLNEEFMGTTTVSKMAKDFLTNCLDFDNSARLLDIVDGLINHPFIQNAITNCDNEHDQLINDNPFGDPDWVSEHGLFNTSCDD